MKIAEALESYTASISQFETSRNYVSLSQCALPADELLKSYYQGFEDSHAIRLRCYKGYQMEKDLKQRLIALQDHCFTEHEEITAFDGLVKGHPDLKIWLPTERYPADCKSVPLDEHLPELKVPRKVFWQMNGYMLYAKVDRSVVIYESRETGKVRDYWLHANRTIQQEIEIKLNFVVNQIKIKAA